MRLLIDENVPPVVSKFLEDNGHDVLEVREIAKGTDDKDIVDIALERDRDILTLDLDFGHIYFFSRRGELNIYVIRPRTLNISNLRSILEENLEEIEKSDENGLYIMEETGYRVLH